MLLHPHMTCGRTPLVLRVLERIERNNMAPRRSRTQSFRMVSLVFRSVTMESNSTSRKGSVHQEAERDWAR